MYHFDHRRAPFGAYLLLPAALLASVTMPAAAGAGGSSAASLTTTFPGTASPSGQWPYPNGDLANTRVAPGSVISSANVSQLREAWAFKLTGKAAAGVSYAGSLTAAPVVATASCTCRTRTPTCTRWRSPPGKLKWEYQVNMPEATGPGPDGVAVADGTVYGDTSTSVFALNAATGKTIWVDSHLLNRGQGAFEIQPQVADGRVYLASAYGSGPGGGVLMALDAANGHAVVGVQHGHRPGQGRAGSRPRLRRRLGDAAGGQRRLGDLRHRQPVPVHRRGDRVPVTPALHRQRGEPGRGDREAALVLPGRAERLHGPRPAGLADLGVGATGPPRSSAPARWATSTR